MSRSWESTLAELVTMALGDTEHVFGAVGVPLGAGLRQLAQPDDAGQVGIAFGIIAGRIRREQKNYRPLASLVAQHCVQVHFPDADKGNTG